MVTDSLNTAGKNYALAAGAGRTLNSTKANITAFNSSEGSTKVQIRFVYSNPILMVAHSRNKSCACIFYQLDQFDNVGYKWFANDITPTVTYTKYSSSAGTVTFNAGAGNNYFNGYLYGAVDQVREVTFPT